MDCYPGSAECEWEWRNAAGIDRRNPPLNECPPISNARRRFWSVELIVLIPSTGASVDVLEGEVTKMLTNGGYGDPLQSITSSIYRIPSYNLISDSKSSQLLWPPSTNDYQPQISTFTNMHLPSALPPQLHLDLWARRHHSITQAYL